MSKNARPFGESSCGQVLGQRLGGDDVAPDRDDPAAERGHDAVRVAVRGDDDVLREDRAAVGLDDEAAVRLAPDRRRPDALVEVGAGAVGARPTSPAKYLPGWSRPPRRDDEAAVVEASVPISSREPLLAARTSPRSPNRASVSTGVARGRPRARRPGEIEVAALAELAVDGLVGDQPLDERRSASMVSRKQRPGRSPRRSARRAPRAPLVAGVDDPAVAGRAAEAELLGLERA